MLVLNLVRNRVYISCRIWSTAQFNIPPPPTATHCLYSVHTIHLVREGGREEEVREKVEGQQYTNTVPSSMGATSVADPGC